jgi:hypothetical protein
MSLTQPGARALGGSGGIEAPFSMIARINAVNVGDRFTPPDQPVLIPIQRLAQEVFQQAEVCRSQEFPLTGRRICRFSSRRSPACRPPIAGTAALGSGLSHRPPTISTNSCAALGMNRRAQFDNRGDFGDAGRVAVENVGDRLAALLASHDDDVALAFLVSSPTGDRGGFRVSGSGRANRPARGAAARAGQFCLAAIFPSARSSAARMDPRRPPTIAGSVRHNSHKVL